MADDLPPVSVERMLETSLLYRQRQAQHEEVLRHKWYESEKAGYDVGYDWASTDWTLKHGSRWLAHWRQTRSLAQRPRA